MENALTFLPLFISGLFLAVVSFMKKSKKKKMWLIYSAIVFFGILAWTINRLGVFTW